MKKITKASLIVRYLPAIKFHYPDIDPKTITVFREGYDHDVLVVGAHDAFRFPRTKKQGVLDTVENIFFPVFAKTSPVTIPNVTGYRDSVTGQTYQRYRFIPGVQLTVELSSNLPSKELEGITVIMGAFLTRLHAFPLVRARAMNMEELNPITYWKFFEDQLNKMKTTMFPLLSKNEQRWIENLYDDYIDICKDHPFQTTVTHSDLAWEHIIVDPTIHQLAGVIDFSLRIADPAIDFAFFDRYGPLFLKTVYENYTTVDAYFDQRRIFYAGHIPIINLYESIEKKDIKMTKIHLMQLKKYISQNPLP